MMHCESEDETIGIAQDKPRISNLSFSWQNAALHLHAPLLDITYRLKSSRNHLCRRVRTMKESSSASCCKRNSLEVAVRSAVREVTSNVPISRGSPADQEDSKLVHRPGPQFYRAQPLQKSLSWTV